jgi:peptidoglycan/LPS O-acetylase OafA/YrhL
MTLEFKALNGLRFPACVLVFTVHLPVWSHPGQDWLTGWVRGIGEQGHAAMAYFFVLSGFVLAHAYGELMLGADGKLAAGGIRQFLIRRGIRLFPLHWLGLALILPWAFLTGNINYAALLPHLTLTQSLIPDSAIIEAFNGPSWSLSDELVFAAMFPVLMLAFGQVGMRLRVLLLLGVVLAPAMAAVFVAQAGRSGVFLLYINPFARVVEFAGGMLIYMLWQKYRWQMNGLAWEILPIGLLVAGMQVSAHLGTPYSVAAPFVPAAMLLTMVFASGTGPLRQALSSALALRLGRLAFAFYVLHYIIIRYVEITPLARLAAEDNTRLMLIPLLFGLSLLGAIVVHHGFERRVEPRLRAWLMQRPYAVS